MSEFEDPCRELEIEEGTNTPAGSGDGSSPQPQEDASIEYDFTSTPPQFPSAQNDIPEPPNYRYSVIVPRQFYYLPYIFPWIPRSPSVADDDRIQGLQGEQESDLRRLSDDLVDKFRFCTGRVYNEFYKPSDNFNQYLGFKASGEMQQGVPLEIGKTDNLGTLPLPEQVNPGYPISSQINILNKELVRLGLSHRMTEGISNFENEDAEFLMKNVIPAKNREFNDNSFKAPAAYFAKETDQRNDPFPHVVDIQVRIPNQFIYDDEIPTWLGGEYDYASRRPELDVPPELTKQSLYRRFSFEYGLGEGTDSVPFPCAEDEMVQKFPAEETIKMLNINEYAFDQRGNTDFASYYNIAQPVTQIHTRIAFPTPDQDKGEITRLLADHDLDSFLLGILDPESVSTEKIYAQILESKVELDAHLNTNVGDKVSKYYKPRAQEDILNLMELYLSAAENTATYRALAEAMDPDDYPLGFSTDPSWETFLNPDTRNIWNAEMTTNLASFGEDLLDFIADKTRTFDRILKGNMSYSEVIAYRIEKINKATDEVIQQFYFFNSSEISEFEFLDTQILYGQEYTYNIYTINFVVGSKYRYGRGPEFKFEKKTPRLTRLGQPRHDYSLEVPVITSTYFSIIEAPYFSQNVLVADLPPLSPEIKFFRGDVGVDLVQSLMVFEQNHGRYTETPIEIREGDREIIEKMSIVQNIEEGTTDLQYGSDSTPTHYQMFSLVEEPRSYQDFSEGRFEETTSEYPYFAVYFRKDQIYYLCFRTRDYAGISNPSKVIKVMIDVDGYWEIELYDFPEAEEDSLEFDRYLEIDLADIQTYIDLSSSDNYPNQNETEELTETSRGTEGVSLGAAEGEDSVWNREFVFRVTSTETGETIDLRTSYSHINLRSIFNRFIPENILESIRITDFISRCIDKRSARENTFRILSSLRRELFNIDAGMSVLLQSLSEIGVFLGAGDSSDQSSSNNQQSSSGYTPRGKGNAEAWRDMLPKTREAEQAVDSDSDKTDGKQSGNSSARKAPAYGPGHSGEY